MFLPLISQDAKITTLQELAGDQNPLSGVTTKLL